MLEFRKGNLFDSGCEALTNACNTIGIMGGGIAYAFKVRYPEMYKEYSMICQEGKLAPGILHIWDNPKGYPKYVINFPTKTDLSPSKNVYIVAGLKTLIEQIKNKDIKSVALPALGCGLGGLSWTNVKHFIEVFAKEVPEDVLIAAYEPK
jgi:O-acetyl-ADP-ribose deacetylase (regulator of RNase III)